MAKKAAKRTKTKKKVKVKAKAKARKVKTLKTRSLKAGQAASVKGGATPQLLAGIKDAVGIKIEGIRIGAVLPTSPIVGIK
jgi:hypothetical protein